MHLKVLFVIHGIGMTFKGQIYTAKVRSVLPFGSKTWPLRTEYMESFVMFVRRCLRNTGGVFFINNSEARRQVPGPKVQSLGDAMN